MAGATSGAIRAMNDDRGRKVRQARPSMPVEILGLLEMPQAGDPLQVVDDEREARSLRRGARAAARAGHTEADRAVRLEDTGRRSRRAGRRNCGSSSRPTCRVRWARSRSRWPR